mgnify:CR=1 FL=1
MSLVLRLKYSIVPSNLWLSSVKSVPILKELLFPAFDQTRPIEPPKVHYNSDFNPFKTSSASSYSGGGSYSRPKVDWEGLYDGLEKASKMNTPMEEEPFVDETDWTSAPASVDMSEERTPYVQETETVSSPSANGLLKW